ncbi:helix-turn-helix domain-containing protein, partial [Enterococcus sp. 7E2_DIV0204]
ISSLAKEYDLTERSLKKILLELTNEISESNNNTFVELISTPLNFVLYNHTKDDAVELDLLNYLKLEYFSTSSKYAAFKYIMEYRECTISKMAEGLAYSISYLYKLINKLNRIFKELLLDTSIQLYARKTIRLIGPEHEIRLLHYYFTVKIFLDDGWPLVSISEQQILENQKYIKNDDYGHLSILGKKKANLFIGISLNSMQRGKFLPEFNEWISGGKEILAVFSVEESLKSMRIFYHTNYQKNMKKVDSEIFLLSMFSLFSLPEILYSHDKMRIADKLIQIDNKVIKNTKKIVTIITKNKNLSLEKKKLIFFESIVIIINMLFFDIWKSYNQVNTSQLSTTTDELFQLLIGMCKSIPVQALPICLKELQILVDSYAIYEEKKVIQIYIETCENIIVKSRISNYISVTYSNAACVLTENIGDADIIITDAVPVNHAYKGKVIFFSDIDSIDNWKRLGSIIQQEVFMTNISKINIT